MSGYALSGAFRAVCALNQYLHDKWDEQTFRLYYYALSQDPRDLLHVLPLGPSTITKIASGIDNARNNMLNSTATRIASGSEARPTMGNAWAGFMVHMQNGLRPALDIALRTGMGAPMRLALLGGVAILLCDMVYGGHVRDSVSHVLASFNSESGRAAEIAEKTKALKRQPTDYRPEVFRLYAPPSVS